MCGQYCGQYCEIFSPKMSMSLISSFKRLKAASVYSTANVKHEALLDRANVLLCLDDFLRDLELVLCGESWKVHPATRPLLLSVRKSFVSQGNPKGISEGKVQSISEGLSVLKPSICVDSLCYLESLIVPVEDRVYVSLVTLDDLKRSVEFVRPLVVLNRFDWIWSLRECVLQLEYVLVSYMGKRGAPWENPLLL